MKVKDIMVKSVVTLDTSDTIKDAFEKFAAHDISGCPVVDRGKKVIGMFTETDLLAVLKIHQREVKMLYPPYIPIGISFVETKQQKEVMSALMEMGNKKIGDVMKRNVITIGSGEPIEEALRLMVERCINRLPVVENGRLVGIVTRGDVIKGLYEKSKQSQTKDS